MGPIGSGQRELQGGLAGKSGPRAPPGLERTLPEGLIAHPLRDQDVCSPWKNTGVNKAFRRGPTKWDDDAGLWDAGESIEGKGASL